MRLRAPVSTLALPLLAFAALTLGCGSSPAPAPTPARAPAPAPAPAPTSAASSSPPLRGLAAQENDAAIVAAARAAMACKMDDSDGFDADCPGFKAWTELEAPFMDGKNDATLVNMLEDDDKRVRLLGAMEIEEHGEAYKKDRALAERTIAAGGRETVDAICTPLGGAIGEIDIASSGTFDRIAELARSKAKPDLRGRIISRLLDNNKSSEQAYKLTAELCDDEGGGETVRTAAIEALPRGSGHVDDTCATLKRIATSDTETAGATAARRLAHTKQCASSYDDVLGALEARQSSGAALGSWYFCSALWNMCEDPKGTAAQRKRAIAIARKVLDGKDEERPTRLEALDAIARCDPGAGSRATLARYAKDKDKEVGAKATRLLAHPDGRPPPPPSLAPKKN